jgi:hypothetical protein
VIAGFILVGGPGDARERRLDEMTLDRAKRTIDMAHCVFNSTGSAPSAIEEASKVRAAVVNVDNVTTFCGVDLRASDRISTGEQPATRGDVTYRAIDASHIRICGNFYRSQPDDRRDYYRSSLWTAYPQLLRAHPAGIHCFEFELVKGADLSNYTNSHAGHMDVFE